jgi:protein-tyrosine phosphatase
VKPTLFPIDRDGPGRLATMACPRGGDWLADEMTALRAEGVDVLVCALTDSEVAEQQVTAGPQLAAQAGLTYIAFPITGSGVPKVPALTDLVGELEEILKLGRFVVVHCLAGVGRSSLIAGAVLVHEGLDPAEAWNRIETARGRPVPDTEEQRMWLARFAGE